MSKYDQKFVAALALFSSIYDEKAQDSYCIIQEFIKACLKTNNVEFFSINDIKEWLISLYGIDLPQPVIVKALVKIDNSEIHSKGEGYTCHINKAYDIQSKINSECFIFDKILSDLCKAVCIRSSREITKADQEEIKSCFFDFLLGKENNSEFYALVAKTVLTNNYKDLSSIKEGLVVYNGLKYSKEVDNNTWKKPIVIFLDTEYLFDAVGLNGVVRNDIFKEFLDLVKSINEASFKRYGEADRISLAFFYEIKTEIDSYFGQALRIKNGNDYLRCSESAMKTIVNSCKEANDILEYKAKIISDLRDCGIVEYSEISQTEISSEFLIEESNLINDLEQNVGTKEGERKDVLYYVKLCDYVNFLRGGHNDRHLEDIEYLFLSRKRVAIEVSKFISHSYASIRIPFITNLDFVIEKLWYKLKRPFINCGMNSFDIIIRSKIVLSNLMQKSILPEYEKLEKKINSGELSLEVAKEYYNELRSSNIQPEDISQDNADSCLAFINSNNNLEEYLMAQSSLKSKAMLVDKLREENEEICKEKDALTNDKDLLLKQKAQMSCSIEQKNSEIESLRKEKYLSEMDSYIKNGVKKCVFHTVLYFIFIGGVVLLNFLCDWLDRQDKKMLKVCISIVFILLTVVVPGLFNNNIVYKGFKIKKLKEELRAGFENSHKFGKL